MRGAARLQSIGDLLAQPADHLAAAAIVEREQQRDETAGREAAEVAQPLHQDHLGAIARRGDRRRYSGGAAADDEHFGLRLHGSSRDGSLMNPARDVI